MLRLSGEPSPEDRWGGVYAILAVVLDLYLLRGRGLAAFVLDVLAILTAAFIGPFAVRVAAGLLRTDWSGLALGAMTWLACFLATVVVRLILAAFR